MRSALQLLLPNAEAAVYIAGSVCAAFVANIDGHSDKLSPSMGGCSGFETEPICTTKTIS
ncbi:hypothetical protein Zm00014a_007220 [Zea mays]|uniref:Uncharacterized protein n=1 Tax=Zea mays TaxID=4577 RepID=A0A3L6E8I9_MAIZE|nr:hypothetical protein Zm00014a_007220 [Zea mays]